MFLGHYKQSELSRPVIIHGQKAFAFLMTFVIIREGKRERAQNVIEFITGQAVEMGDDGIYLIA